MQGGIPGTLPGTLYYNDQLVSSLLFYFFSLFLILHAIIKHQTFSAALTKVGFAGTLSSTKQGPPGNIPPYMYPHLAEHVATANVYAVIIN